MQVFKAHHHHGGDLPVGHCHRMDADDFARVSTTTSLCFDGSSSVIQADGKSALHSISAGLWAVYVTFNGLSTLRYLIIFEQLRLYITTLPPHRSFFALTSDLSTVTPNPTTWLVPSLC